MNLAVEDDKLDDKSHQSVKNDKIEGYSSQSFINVHSIESFDNIDSEVQTQKSASTTRQVSSSSTSADKYRVMESEDDLGKFEIL